VTARPSVGGVGPSVDSIVDPIVGPHVHRNNQKMIPASETAWRVAQDAQMLGIRVDASRGQNQFREIDSGHEFANLCSCSYLGLNSHPQVLQGGIDALRTEAITGLSMAEFRIRLGLMERLEHELAELYGGPVLPGVTSSALTAAILPVLGSGHLTQSGPLVMAFDKFAHFSMQFMRPIVADETKVVTLPHNDMNALEDLCRTYPRVAYVCDGVYSTGGATDLPALLTLQDKYGLFLYIDDSHGLAIQGARGEGYIRSRLPALNERTLIIASIAKAFGSTGGIALLGSRRHYDFLYRTGPMGWSQALRTAAIGTSLGSLQVHRSPELGVRQAQLARNIALFDRHIQTAQRGDGLHIKVVEVGAQDKAVTLSRALYQRGFYCSAVFFPIVAVGRAGIRIMLRGDLPTEQVQAFIGHLTEVLATLEHGPHVAP
jgi:7-keto-8-aminopelargonate synthetase-like enzyme